jgi:hypothetical protein
MRLALLGLLLLAGCGQSVPGCPEGSERQLLAQLIFGRNIGTELRVNEEDWRAFIDGEVTTRFPAGFTVLDAAGQWRDSTAAAIVREPAKLILVAAPDTRDSRLKLTAVIESYKARFNQQSVVRIETGACVAY